MEEVKVGNSRFKRVCVFCGSSTGKRHCYQDAAVELGKVLVARKVDLVYGGGSVGLMGLVSEAVHSGETFGEVKPVASMHQRKAEMARHSDAFIALPGPTFPHPSPFAYPPLSGLISLHLYRPLGGYGTLEEVLEVITWSQLGIHNKPVGLLNVDGYYNSLLAFIDKAVEDGFIQPYQRHIFVSAPNAKDLVQKLEVLLQYISSAHSLYCSHVNLHLGGSVCLIPYYFTSSILTPPVEAGIRARGRRCSRQTELGDGADGTKLHPARRDRSVVFWVLRYACIPRHISSLAAVIFSVL
ncbi:hypothetical protein BHM03_00031990 [Ensete ventricosum]|nr:hypothetical protein BHM03_00031990 [Ensete ventricosum]